MDGDAAARSGAIAASAATSHLVRPLTFSTGAFRPTQQGEAWRASNAPSLDITLDGPAEAGFRAERTVTPLGPLVMNRVAAQGSLAIRNARRARRDGLDHWAIGLTTRGTRQFRMERDDRCVHLEPGQLFILSLDEPYRARREDGELIGVFLPRDSVPALAPRLDRLRGRALDDPSSRLLGGYLAMLWERLPTLDVGDLPLLADATRAMVAACINPTPDTLAAAGPHLAEGQRARAVAIIRKNIRSPRLSPRTLAGAIRISRSQIYRLFESDGGVGAVILRERLRAVRLMLANPGDRRSIGTIAEAAGFFDASSFSRLFRKHFGMTASEFRSAEAEAGQTDAPSREFGVALADFLMR